VPASIHYSLQHLAWTLGIPLERLRWLAVAPDTALYRPFEKRRAGKKPRPIDNPSEELKFVQRRIRETILEPLPLPSWMHGCVKGKGAFTNADVHKGQSNLTRIDVKRFFPNVTYRMVYQIFIDAGFGPEPARLLTRLTTRGGHLPQGAPTSDRLANLYLASIASELEAIFTKFELKYSAYVDDIAFSGQRTREAIGPVIALLGGIGLTVSHSKCKNAGPMQRHELTGFLTNSADRPTLRKGDRSVIRAVVDRLIKARRCGYHAATLEHSVRTRLGLLRVTSPGQAERLNRQLLRNGIDLSLRPREPRLSH
jgi:retron-type reverse transcriptase